MIVSVWTIFEVVGTIAFAASGAVAAIRKEFDLFGVMILAVITAVGGGLLRDLLIGNIPPLALRDPTYILISLVTAIAVCVYYRHLHHFQHLLQVCDALGLGAFTATSATMAVDKGWDTLLMVVTLGTITSIGGGILRDVLTREIPLIFQKEVYALAAVAGAASLYCLHLRIAGSLLLYVSFLITAGIRLVCLYHNLHVPTVRTGK